jgi:hypothetical protein
VRFPDGPRLELLLLSAALLLCLAPHWAPALAGALPLALYFPGRALSMHLEPDRAGEGFRRAVLACGLSFAITPLSLRLAGLALPFGKAMVLGVLGGFSLLLLLAAARRSPRQVPRAAGASHAGWAVAIPLLLTAALLLPGLWIGPYPAGGETRTKGWDLHNHQAVSEAIVYGGLPPTNPFLASSSPFYYHAYFHILDGSLLAVCGARAPAYGITAGLTIAAALLFLAVFYLVLADFTGRRRAALLALLPASLAGGYDLAPILLRIFRSHEFGTWGEVLAHRWNVDAWISHQKVFIPSLFAQFYWAPHAVSGVTVFLLALYFLEKENAGRWAFAGAGVCLAAMAGYNGYVALGGVITVALLRGSALLSFLVRPLQYRSATLRRSFPAGVTAMALSWPVLDLYFGEGGGVDKFRRVGAGPLLPIQLVIDFGPALILALCGALLAWRSPDLRKGLLPFLLMGAPALPLICLVASTGLNNDLAMRISMMIWIALAAYAGLALDLAWGTRRWRRAAVCVLLPGILATVWFAVGAAMEKPVIAADEVAVGRWVRRHVPRGMIVQGSPLRSFPELVYLGGHPAVLSDSWMGRFYSVPADFDRNLEGLVAIFSSEDPVVSCAGLARMRVTALVVGPQEIGDFPILGRPLPWSCLDPVYHHGGYRVLRIRP